MQLSDRIGRRMKLQDLHVFQTVVKAGSMGKAAAILNSTQPNITRSIAALEQTLGVRLLDRHYRGVEPTDFGRALLKRSQIAFDELRASVEDIEFLTDPTAGGDPGRKHYLSGRKLRHLGDRPALIAVSADDLQCCGGR